MPPLDVTWTEPLLRAACCVIVVLAVSIGGAVVIELLGRL